MMLFGTCSVVIASHSSDLTERAVHLPVRLVRPDRAHFLDVLHEAREHLRVRPDRVQALRGGINLNRLLYRSPCSTGSLLNALRQCGPFSARRQEGRDARRMPPPTCLKANIRLTLDATLARTADVIALEGCIYSSAPNPPSAPHRIGRSLLRRAAIAGVRDLLARDHHRADGPLDAHPRAGLFRLRAHARPIPDRARAVLLGAAGAAALAAGGRRGGSLRPPQTARDHSGRQRGAGLQRRDPQRARPPRSLARLRDGLLHRRVLGLRLARAPLARAEPRAARAVAVRRRAQLRLVQLQPHHRPGNRRRADRPARRDGLLLRRRAAATCPSSSRCSPSSQRIDLAPPTGQRSSPLRDAARGIRLYLVARDTARAPLD